MNFTKSFNKNIFNIILRKNSALKLNSRQYRQSNLLTNTPSSLNSFLEFLEFKIHNGFQSTNNGNFLAMPILALSFFNFFKKKEDEDPEEKLIMTIKRSILSIQKEEYAKAEQMLHLALRMAQDLNSRDGITYVYDVMANLAMEREQFDKAEKLFKDVMKRLFSDGHKEDSLKILHISSKIAHMAQLEGNYEKALQGFQWTTKKIADKLKQFPEDPEIQELWGLTQNWFGQLWMQMERYPEAKKCILDAYDIYVKTYGNLNEEAVTMLNNLSVACSNLGDSIGAKKYLEEAVNLANQLPELAITGVLKANLGLIYMSEGLLELAKETCSSAWKWGKKNSSKEATKQAEYCLDKIKKITNK